MSWKFVHSATGEIIYGHLQDRENFEASFGAVETVKKRPEVALFESLLLYSFLVSQKIVINPNIMIPDHENNQ